MDLKNKMYCFLSLLMWMLISSLLAMTVIGLLVFIPRYNKQSSWCEVGSILVKNLIK